MECNLVIGCETVTPHPRSHEVLSIKHNLSALWLLVHMELLIVITAYTWVDMLMMLVDMNILIILAKILVCSYQPTSSTYLPKYDVIII